MRPRAQCLHCFAVRWSTLPPKQMQLCFSSQPGVEFGSLQSHFSSQTSLMFYAFLESIKKIQKTLTLYAEAPYPRLTCPPQWLPSHWFLVTEMFTTLCGTLRKTFCGRAGKAKEKSKRAPLPKLPLAPRPVRPVRVWMRELVRGAGRIPRNLQFYLSGQSVGRGTVPNEPCKDH